MLLHAYTQPVGYSKGRVEVIAVRKFGKVRSHNSFFENMSKKEKSVFIIEFSGRKADWESWSEKFLLHGKQQG